MKKILLFAAVAVVAMASCSKNEVTVDTTAPENAIGFGTYVGTATKALVMDDTNLKKPVATDATSPGAAGGFGVFGYYHEAEKSATNAAVWDGTKTAADFMWNEKMEYTSSITAPSTIGNWIYSPIKYWPNDTYDRITFFAYAPYADGTTEYVGIKVKNNPGTVSTDNLTSPVLDFSIQSTPANMVDLVADYKINVNKLNSGSENILEFSLKHLLTRADFKVKLDGDVVTDQTNSTETTVILKKVMLVGTDNSNASTDKLYDKSGIAENSVKFYKTNTFTFNSASDMKDPTTAQGVGAWSTEAQSESNEFTGYVLQTANYDLDDAANSNTGSILNFTEVAVTGADAPVDGTTKYSANHRGLVVANNSADIANATVTNVFTTSHYLFLLPSNDDTGLATAGDIRVYLEYEIITKDAKLPEGISITNNHDIVDLPANSLQAGKAYVFTFSLGLHSVNVSAEIETGWADGDVQADIDTPATPAID